MQPVLTKTCTPCHNQQLASGGMVIAPFTKAGSLTANRSDWERILDKLRAGEMPPRGIPRPPQLDAAIAYVQHQFELADKDVKPDPGRVTARRLNRAEYSNTIRDLLGVEFHAEKSFPTDDLGNGFDNIGDVLTVSPVLMEKYLSAAQKISAKALGADPLPKKPLQIQFAAKDKKIRRVDASTIEAVGEIPFDGEYDIIFGLPGERAPDAKPVTLGFWVDGKLLHSQSAETKPSELVYFNPYSEEHMRLFLSEGDHEFRAGFIGDDFVNGLTPKELYNSKKNKYLDSITFVGPYPAKVERASRKKILICDPETGAPCVDKIISTLARHAYRRPVTRAEVAALTKFVALAKANGETTEQGIQLAIEAMLVSPNFLFRIEHDAFPTDPSKIHRVSDVELASRLSYFLWSSMPDDELLSLAESGKLHEPAVLDAQVKRMLADDRSSAIADNFAGQWLELRNLNVVKPDPQKFPEWGPELRDAMYSETRLFFDYVLRAEPSAGGLSGCALHVPERPAGEVLRHRGRDRSGVPQSGPGHRPAGRHPRAGQRSDGFELPDADLGGAARPVHPGEHIGQPGSSAAAGCAAARRSGRRHVDVAPAADGEAPRRSRLRLVPQQDGPAGIRPRELRRHRQMADHGRQVPRGCQRHAAQRQDVFHSRRNAFAARKPAPRICAPHGGEDADLCAGKGPGKLRSPYARRDYRALGPVEVSLPVADLRGG